MLPSGKWVIAPLALLACVTAHAQATEQFWPEFNAYARIQSNTRFRFELKDTREGTDIEQTEFGPSIEFYAKPLIRLRDLTAMPRDQAKERLLVLGAGYRYLFSASKGTAENRILLEGTPQYPLVWKFILADRNRMELRFIQGIFSWRYRNRLSVRRNVRIRSYTFAPYIRCEVYYSSQFGKWYDTATSAGSRFPLTKALELEAFVEHQNETNQSPNKQVNSLGLVLNAFF